MGVVSSLVGGKLRTPAVRLWERGRTTTSRDRTQEGDRLIRSGYRTRCGRKGGRHSGQAVLALLLALSDLVPAALHGQLVHGRLIDTGTGAAIDRAFVVMLNADGSEVNRVLTSMAGEFILTAPGPGSYRFRSDRIGFSSVLTDPVELGADETREIEIRVSQIVIRLDTITVEDDAKECRVYGEQGLATALVWEEARKLLAAVAWSQSQLRFSYDARTYERRLGGMMRVLAETETLQAGLSAPPYHSVPADIRRQHGYAFVSRDSVTFYAPDAEEFFSDEFLARHCFNLTEGDGRLGFIGLEFEPVRGSELSDVRGVFWLEAAASEIRWLELGYTHVRPPAYEREARGRVEFDQIQGGPWFVSRWWIRVPRLRVPHPLDGPNRWIKDGYYEVGGEVLRIFDTDGRQVFESGGAG